MVQDIISATYPPDPLKPALSPQSQSTLTGAFTALYSFLFLVVYVQLWMILYYKHRRLSYQTVFLFLCLIWAGLRTTLFSFYFKNSVLANNLPTALYWLLYCFPVCLQFISLCLLVEFFAQVVFKTRTRYGPGMIKRRHVWLFITVSILGFLITNITCAVVEQRYEAKSESSPLSVLMVRVVINGCLFIVMGVALSVCIYKIGKTSAANMVLEAKGITARQAFAVCILVTLLYTSRALYNMIAISKPLSDKILNFGYNWINVSDQADFGNLNAGFAYVSFGIVLFVWEFLPTFIVVMFFRVKKPNDQMQLLTSITSQSYNRPQYFTDQPANYGSTDELFYPRLPGDGSSFDGNSPQPINSFADVDFHIDHFGSYTHEDMPGTPPPLKITHDVLFEDT